MNYLLKYLVPTLLGDYIEGVDYDNIKTSYFSGLISLQNISLKKDIFTKKGIPLDISYSTIGQLELRIPWLKVRKEPILVTINDLYLVITLSDPQKIDPVRQRIFFMNEISRACYEKTKSIDAQEEKSGNFSSVKVNILDNVQVSLKNIHVRFEDPDRNAILGFVLDEFSVFTTNENWEKEFLDRTMEANRLKNLCKKATISNLISYCIIEKDKSKFLVNQAFTDDYRKNYLKVQMEGNLKQNLTKTKESEESSHLIFKMTAELKVITRNKNLDSIDDPKIYIFLNVKQQGMTLKHKQVEHLLLSAERATNIRKMIEHHPPELSSEEIAIKQKEFEMLMKKYIESRKGEDADWVTLYDEDKTELGNNFRKYLVIVSDEMIITSVNEAIFEAEKKSMVLNKKKQGGIRGFFSKKPTEITEEESAMADEFMEQLIQKNEEELKKMSEGFLFRICVQVESGALFLINEEQNKMNAGVSFEMDGFECKLESWKLAELESFQVSTKIDQIMVFLKSKSAGSDYYKQFNIVQKLDEKNEHKKEVVDIVVRREIDKNTERLMIKGGVQELVVNYLTSFFHQLVKFSRFESRLHNLEQIANQEIGSLKTGAGKNFKDLIDKVKKLEMSIDFMVASPKFVIPLIQNGDLETDVWLANVGNIHITTPQKTKFDETMYRIVGLSVTGLSLQYFKKWKDWIEKKAEAEHQDVVEDTNANLLVCYMHSAIQNSGKAAAMIVDCELELIALNASKLLMVKLLQLPYCLDFTKESGYHELLVTQKAQIMRSQPVMFKLLYGEEKDASCIGLFYEYYLYLYKSPVDLSPMKIIRLVDLKIDLKQTDDYYMIELIDPTKEEETYLSFTEKDGYEKFTTIMYERIGLGKEILGEQKLSLKTALNQLDSPVSPAKEKKMKSLEDDVERANFVPEDKTLIEFQTKIKKLTLSLESKQAHFSFSVEKMELTNTSRTLQKDLSFNINSFQVRAKKNGVVHNLISSERFPDSKFPHKEALNIQLFSWNSTTFSREHPEYLTKGCKGNAEAIFNSLYVFWKPLLISEMLFTVTDALDEKRIEDIRLNRNQVKVKVDSDILKQKQIKDLTNALQSEKPLEFDTLNIKTIGLFVSLFTPKTEIEMACFSLNNLEMAITSDLEKSRYKGRLENLVIADMTNYPYTISDNKSAVVINELFGIDKKAKSILEFDVIRYVPYHPKLIDQKRMLFQVNLNSVVINYIQQPVLRLIDYVLNYFLNLDVTQLIASDDRTLQEMRDEITNATFNDIKITIEKTKVIARAHPSLSHWFELEVDMLEIVSAIVPHRKRLKDNVKSIKFTYNEAYRMLWRGVTLSKVIENKEKITFTNQFDFNLDYERCLYLKEYSMLVNDELKTQDLFPVDDSYKLTGHTTKAFELRIKRDEYVELIDTVFHNILNDDFKDYLYCFRPHLLKEELPIIRWTAKDERAVPVSVDFLFESIMLTLWDETRELPLTRLQAINKKMSILRTQDRKVYFDFKFYELQAMKYHPVSKDEVTEASILSVTAFSEHQSVSMMSNRRFLIRPGLNLEYVPFQDEKDAAFGKEEEERISGKAAPYSENLTIKVSVIEGRKTVNVDMKDLKVMIYLEEMMRIFDFIIYVPEPLLEEDREAQIKMGEVVEYREPTSLVFTVMANDSYFCIPSGTEYAIILKSDVVFSYSNRDVQQLIVNSMIEKKLEELYTYKLTMQRTEMMVASEKDFTSSLPLAELTKRILVHPFNLSFSLKTEIYRDQASSKMALFRKDNIFIDQVAIRIASRDLILLLESNFYLKQNLASYKKLVPFTDVESDYKSKLNQRKQLRDDYFARWKIEQMGHDVNMIALGIQLRLINETQKYSLPLMDFTVIGDSSEPSVAYNFMKGFAEMKSRFSLASNYYNPNNSCWEPFIEKFEISLEAIQSIHNTPNLSLSMTVKKPLNINISNELIDSALSTIFEWKQKYAIRSSNKIALSKGKKSGTLYRVEASDQNLNKTENVSPYSIQNMTGYPITIIPSEKSMKIELMEEETKDIRFEKSVEELFSTQREQDPFAHHKVAVLINHPEATIPRSDTIIIDELAVKDVFFPVSKGIRPQLFCEIHDIGKKRYITFTSPVQISNEFDVAFDVKFFKRDGKKLTEKTLEPGKTTSIPFDMVSECLAITPSHADKKNTKGYAIADIIKEQQIEIELPTMFCKLAVSFHKKYAVIRICPILKIKNCLPIKLTFEVTNKEIGETRKQVGSLLCQEAAQINALSLQDSFFLRVGLAGYSASAKIQLSSRKEVMLVKKISLKGSTGSVDLRVYRPPDDNYEIIIYAKSCIVNETSIPLLYFLKDYKPFPGSSDQNAKGTLVFDKIKEIRIQPMMIGGDFTEEIPIEGLGDRSVDMRMGKSPSRRFNLGLNISSQLCDRKYNLMTKVVSVAPRFVVLNETPYSLIVIQDRAEALDSTMESNERLIMHFQEPQLRKFLRFKIKTGNDGVKWLWAGAVDCTGPGEYYLIMLDSQYQRAKYFRVSITLESPSYYIQIFEQLIDKTAMRIVNDLDCLDLTVAQVGMPDKVITIPRKKRVSFGWFEPCDCKNVLVVRLLDGLGGNPVYVNNYTFDKIGEKIPILTNYKHQDKVFDIFMEINLEGSSKVMRFITQSSKASAKTWDFQASLTIHTIGCSVIYSRGKERVEMVYMALHPVAMAIKSDKRKLESQIKIKVIEIDNNTVYNTLYPCVLYPVNFAKENRDTYVLDILTVFYVPTQENQTLHFEKIKILINDIAVQIEGKLLEMFFRFGKRITDQLRKMTSTYDGFTETLFFSPEEKKALLASNAVTYKWQLYNPSASAGSLVYIKELSVYPLQLVLSYQHTTLEKSEDDLLENFINTSFVSSIANFEDAPISLSGLKIEGVWDKWGDIMMKLFANYRSQAADFVLGVAFSSRIIGNPVKFFGGIAQGVQDLVEKPIEGFSEGPLKGGSGLLKGVESLTTKTLGGTFGAVQNITGSLADGLSRLAVDKQYEISRDQAKAKKNTNVLTGIAQGVMSFGKSTVSGVTGVVTKPVEGAQKGGFVGFLKGTGKGLAGLVVKPVSGTLDAVSKVTEGVSNTIDSKKDRIKTARFRAIRTLYGKNKLIKDYSEEDAIGYQVICAHKGGKFAEGLVWIDSFLWEITSQSRKGGPITALQKTEGYYMLVLGISRVFLLNLTKRTIVWKLDSNNIASLAEVPCGIAIKLKIPDSKIKTDLVPIEMRNDDLQIKALLRLSELMAYIKEKEDSSGMSISKRAAMIQEEFMTLT